MVWKRATGPRKMFFEQPNATLQLASPHGANSFELQMAITNVLRDMGHMNGVDARRSAMDLLNLGSITVFLYGDNIDGRGITDKLSTFGIEPHFIEHKPPEANPEHGV